MPFTLYRVEADLIEPESSMVGEAWVLETYSQAVSLAVRLRETRSDLCNVLIKVRHYG